MVTREIFSYRVTMLAHGDLSKQHEYWYRIEQDDKHMILKAYHVDMALQCAKELGFKRPVATFESLQHEKVSDRPDQCILTGDAIRGSLIK